MLKSREQIQEGPTGISEKGNRNKRGGKWREEGKRKKKTEET